MYSVQGEIFESAEAKESIHTAEAKEFSTAMLGVADFIFRFDDDDGGDHPWVILSNRNVRLRPDHFQERFYHGTTLAQAYDIMRSGFIVGMHHKGTTSSPCGVWGCSEAPATFDRVHIARGWVKESDYIGPWDQPVSLCWVVPSASLTKHKQLERGVCVKVLKKKLGHRLDIRNTPTEIFFNVNISDNFGKLPSVWVGLRLGTRLLCRTRRCEPDDIRNCGNASPMTCARTTLFDDAADNGWVRAQNSGQWRCSACARNYAECVPCTGRYEDQFAWSTWTVGGAPYGS